MTRLEPWTADQLDDAQQRVWDAVTGSRGRIVTDERGGLIGPFNAWLRTPELGVMLADLGAHLRFRSDLDPRLLELVICAVGAHWRSNFEFWAHSRLGREAGLDDAVIDALAAGEDPPLTRPDEVTVYALVRSLLDDRRVPDDLYARAVELLGEAGLMTVAALAGYYTIVSLGLNLFAVGLPAGQHPVWPD
jgi:4-carboxymuconolactone decarboxylase